MAGNPTKDSYRRVCLEVSDGAAEENEESRTLHLGEAELASEIADGSRDVQVGVAVAQPRRALFEIISANVDGDVLSTASGGLHRVQNDARFAGAARAKLHQRARLHILDERRNRGLEQGSFGAREVVLG